MRIGESPNLGRESDAAQSGAPMVDGNASATAEPLGFSTKEAAKLLGFVIMYKTVRNCACRKAVQDGR